MVFDPEIDEHCRKFKAKKHVPCVFPNECDGCKAGEAECWTDFCYQKWGIRLGKQRLFYPDQSHLTDFVEAMA